MEEMIAESDLIMDIERLKDFKRRKLNGNEDALQEVTPSQPQVTPPPTTTTVSVQTTESMSNKKKKSRRSSSRKSPLDISSDETVIIPTIQESMGSLGGPYQIYQTSFSPGLFTATPANKSDSEVSLSSSVKAEFNKPYTKTLTQETVKKSPAKKHKCEEKGKSKGKSKHATKQTQSPSGFPKTVAELRKSANTPPNHMDSSSRATSTPKDSKTGDKNSTACATVTYAPVRHNMGVRLTQPGTSTSPHPYLYVNPATQTNTLFHSEKAGTSQSYNFYGSNP